MKRVRSELSSRQALAVAHSALAALKADPQVLKIVRIALERESRPESCSDTNRLNWIEAKQWSGAVISDAIHWDGRFIRDAIDSAILSEGDE